MKERFSQFLLGWWPERAEPTTRFRFPRRTTALLGVVGVIASFFIFQTVFFTAQTVSGAVSTISGLSLAAEALTDENEAPIMGVVLHDGFVYVGGASTGSIHNGGIRIIDVHDPSNPKLVARITLLENSVLTPLIESSGGSSIKGSHSKPLVTRIESTQFTGDVAILPYAVPIYWLEEGKTPLGVWDVSDPPNPRFLTVFTIGLLGEGTGFPGRAATWPMAVQGNLFFGVVGDFKDDWEHGEGPWVFTNKLVIVDLSNPASPTITASWRDPTPDLVINSVATNPAGTRLYLAAVSPGQNPTEGHVFVLDIQDPSEPKLIGRYVYDGPDMINQPSAIAPNDDDSLLVLAESSWECGSWGHLRILDIGELSDIHEVATFAIPEADSCVRTLDNIEIPYWPADVEVRGNLVYSTWLSAGLRVIDISDPMKPVQVAEFRPNTNGWIELEFPENVALWHIAVQDDVVITAPIYTEGLYIFRLEELGDE